MRMITVATRPKQGPREGNPDRGVLRALRNLFALSALALGRRGAPHGIWRHSRGACPTTPDHIQSYHPDEQNITYSLRNMHPAQHDLNPRFWGNPTFYTYQVGALALRASKAGAVAARAGRRLLADAPRRGEGVSISSGGSCRLPTRCCRWCSCSTSRGRITGGQVRAGCGGGAYSSSLPVTAVHAHYMTVNAAAVFWSLAAMLFALRIQDKPSWANYVFAGHFRGTRHIHQTQQRLPAACHSYGARRGFSAARLDAEFS